MNPLVYAAIALALVSGALALWGYVLACRAVKHADDAVKYANEARRHHDALMQPRRAGQEASE